jgi:hypothetical protein
MTEQEPDESRVGFKLTDADRQDAARLAGCSAAGDV